MVIPTVHNRILTLFAGALLLFGALASAQWVYSGQYAGSSTTVYYDVYYPSYYSSGFVAGVYPGYFGVPWGFCGDGVCNYWESYNTCSHDCIIGGSPYVVLVDAGSYFTDGCADGTGYGACSWNKPFYCNYNGTLTENANLCGCSQGTQQVGDSCVQLCADGTPSGFCSANQPFYCNGGILVQNATLCGCPSGTAQTGNTSCVDINPTCAASANPNPVNALAPTLVTVNFFELAQAPTSALIDCGNGQVAAATCTASPDAPYSGTCAAQCTYPEQNAYPYTPLAKATLGSLSCGSVNVKVMPPVPTTGSLVARATACATGARLVSTPANLYLNGSLVLANAFTDANGELALTRLPPGLYTLEVNGSAKGLATQGFSALVSAGQTRLIDACLEPSYCDVKAELVKAPSTFAPATPDPVQVRLTNRVNASRTTTLSLAGSLFPLDFTPSHGLSALEQKVVTLTPRPAPSQAGASTAMLAVTTGACTQFLEFPVSVGGGLSLESAEPNRAEYAGGRACYDLLVRNRGSKEGTVTLGATSPFDVAFSSASFFLGREEARRVEACVKVPAGQAAGNHTLTFKAASAAINDAELTATLSVPGPLFPAPSACLEAARSTGTQVVPIQVTNGALGGDYRLEFEPAAAQAGVTLLQPALYNFARGTTRTLSVKVDPYVANGGEHRFSLAVKRLADGLVIQQVPVCARIQGVRGASGQLSASLTDLMAGESKLVRWAVKNEGNTEELFLVAANASFQTLTLNPNSFRLAPGAVKHVEVYLSPSINTPPGLHKVILQAYAGQVASANLLRSEVLEVLVKPNPLTQPSTALKADILPPAVTFTRDANGTTATAVFAVTSRETVNVRVTPSLEDLPSGWSFTFEPFDAVLAPGETANFTATITLRDFETKDYEGTFVLSSGPAQARAPFVIPLASASGLTGLFTLGSVENLALLVLLAMIGAAAYFYYRTRELEQEEQPGAKPSEAQPANPPAPAAPEATVTG